MMGGPGGPRAILEQETLKPQRVGATLRRFGVYFKAFWPVLLLVVVLVVAGTWAQVTAPELIGQAVDCYLTPAASARLTGAAQGAGGFPVQQVTAAESTCWFDTTPAATRSSADTVAGLGRVILLVVGLYIGGSITGGLQFYAMSWVGNHVLRKLRDDLFRQIHRLSLNYYAEHEAGAIMSRLTNDTDTIQQVMSFALVNVTSGILLIFWIMYKMLSLSWAYALLSLAVLPFMIVATLWFSGQARKAFRKAREDLGNALEFCCATDQWIDTPCARLVIEVGSETLQRAGFSAFPGLLVLLAALDTTGARVIRDLGNAVSDEIDHIDARDILLFQQVDGLAFLFAEQGHQHVGAGDLAFSRGLHVKHRALQHPLKTERWLGLAFAVRLGYHRGRGLDELGQLPAQLSEVRAAGTQYPRRGLVVQQGQQQVLDRHELMAPRPRPLEGGVEVQLEILAQHRGSPTTATTPSRIV